MDDQAGNGGTPQDNAAGGVDAGGEATAAGGEATAAGGAATAYRRGCVGW